MRKQQLVWLIFCTLITGACSAQKSKVPKEKNMGAYLMVYFKDDTHGLYMALSKDGYSFTDVNKAKPIIAGDTIAEQKGIRDPYIYRGPDGLFYLALTDLHIYGDKAGYRTTQWERDGKEYGWGNNRGLVLMKSADLVHWSHMVLRVDKAFPELADIGCAWAPEMIYDEVKKKTMLYFSMRYGAGKEKVYYTYMNKGFTAMETHPKSLFDYPNGVPYIDADITKVGNKYHLLYASHDGTSGVKQAVSDSVHTGYQYDPQWYDPEKVGCEAPTIYKRIGENKWVLIYDIYRLNPHNFGFSETSDFVNFKNLGRFNEGVMKATNFSVPKHPAVIQVTRKEAQKLADNWGLDMKF
ncbi:glycoside hydrolase family 43 protein [Mucilaginibacter terrae]|uniref:glycoside hydrolase family 43 protein n=1 Tax=Mucilaginibacter terrae TaxID=1955052 RepID=UPI0036376B33